METKRIFRSRSDRMIAGVAGGLASYLKIDPLFLRIAFVALILFNGVGVLAYLVLWLLLPSEDSSAVGSREQVRENVDEMKTAVRTLVDQVKQNINR